MRGAWQGEFRTGHLDAVALRYGLEVAGGADVIALTHLDTPAIPSCGSAAATTSMGRRSPASGSARPVTWPLRRR